MTGERTPAYRAAAMAVRGPVALMARREGRGGEHLPRAGGFLVVANHLSVVDPLFVGLFLHDLGFAPRFLGKAEIFDWPVAGRVFRSAGQIPVHRGTGLAGQAFHQAVEAIRGGECVVIYPEGTLTRDPGLWPMEARPGAARIALETGAPVIPVVQWGPEQIAPPYGRRLWRPYPRVTVRVEAGAAIDLAAFGSRPAEASVLGVVTGKIMDTLTTMLETVRGEAAPHVRFDPRKMDPRTTDHPSGGRTTNER